MNSRFNLPLALRDSAFRPVKPLVLLKTENQHGFSRISRDRPTRRAGRPLVMLSVTVRPRVFSLTRCPSPAFRVVV